MAILLPQDSLVLNAYAALVGQTPGNAAYAEHKAYIATNGEAAYKAALNTVFANSTTAQLATSLLTNLGLSSIFTQAQAEAYLAANASNRVGAMMDLAAQLYSYNGSDASLVAAKAAYVNAVDRSYNYSINTANVSGATLSGTTISGGQTFTLTDAIGENLVGTSSNDTFKTVLGAKGAATDSTLNLGDTIDGKEGTDTLNILLNGANTALPAGVSISNVEIVNVNVGAAAAASTATALTSSATYAGVQQLWQIDNATGNAGSSVLTSEAIVAAGVTAGYASTGAKATATAFDMAVSAASASQTTLALAVSGVGGGAASGDNTVEIDGAGVKTFTMTGDFVTNAVNDVTLVDANGDLAALATINIGLSSNTKVLFTAGDFATVKTVDFSASTGKITADLTDLTGVGTLLKTIKGGSGADVLTVDLESGVAGITVNAAGGADTVELNGSGAGIDDTATVTLGAGKDTLLVTAAANIAADTAADPTTVAELTETLITVADFKTSEDVLDLAGNGQALTTTQLNNAAAAADLLAATKLVAGYLAAGTVAVFSYGDDAYVFVDTANAGVVDNGDGLIKLVGVDATEFANVQNGNLVL